ncbi:MAG: DNA-directed RNA polymerase subunit beta' [bacterium]
MATEFLKTTDFDAVRLRLASPDTIRSWSYGEVTKPETINYRTQKPEKAGLFAEEIFGPSKDWECYCGKYKKIRYKGIICDKCGVEVTNAAVRRERMGHVELAAPVSHIWFLRGVPSKIGTVLDVGVQSLEKVIYFANFIVTDVNQDAKALAVAELKEEFKTKSKQIEGEFKRDSDRAEKQGAEKGVAALEIAKSIESMTADKDKKLEELEAEFDLAMKELKSLEPLQILSEEAYHEMSMRYGHVFDAGIGAEAIAYLLAKIDLNRTSKALKESLETATSAKHERLVRRLKLISSLIQTGIKPEWMVLSVVPITPPDMRPMVALDGGRFATSDLNDLYRRVINRNNRLRRLKELNAPEVIARNEKRMLQEAVDALIDNNARHSKTVLAATGKKRQLKSLADGLKGKQGRFRQNLLGKRIDYSGRSVIVVGPHLRLDQCGIPKKMALELFKPFVISKLINRGFVHNIRSANRFIEADHAEVWDILEEITKDAHVLLNRAPTLHRLGIQAFHPILIEGKAIQIHPMVCKGFNADFDGDQMAVHVPITEEANREAAELMLATKNLLSPASGRPIMAPDKDIVLGNYYMSMMVEPKSGKMKSFGSRDEAKRAEQHGVVNLREKIMVRLNAGEKLTETNVGRLLFNDLLPSKISYVNDLLSTKKLGDIAKNILEVYDMAKCVEFLDAVKGLGLRQLTKSGISWGMVDVPELQGKVELIDEGNKRAEEVLEQYNQGLLTAHERHTGVVKVWSEIKDRVVTLVKKQMPKDGPVLIMLESGARGSWGQLTQMVGMKGPVTNPLGEIIELPIKSNFREGMNVIEYFISTHGTRKGLSDTALRTANAGYLTRRLVDVAQDVIITMDDCGDDQGVTVTKAECAEIGEPILTRILGRTVIDAIKIGKKTIVEANSIVTENDVKALEGSEPEEVKLRSVMSCRLQKGICAKCYGYDLSYNKPVQLGTAVGIMAAQSIGEPGTQLTMRTFHSGGVAQKDITQGLPRVEELFEARTPKRRAIMSDVSGQVVGIEMLENRSIEDEKGKVLFAGAPGQKAIKIAYKGVEEEFYALEEGDDVRVKDGASVSKGSVIAVMAGNEVLAEHGGTAKVGPEGVGIIFEGEGTKEYAIPPGYGILVKKDDMIMAGDALTDGHLDLQQLFRHKGKDAVMRYLSKEIQHVYASEGARLNNKHIEIMIRQMFSRMYVREAGDTDLLPGELVEKHRFERSNDKVGKKGEIGKGDELLLGITKVSLSTESWLSAASFQETMKVLVNAAVTGKMDTLEGLKENVIIGRLIPVGTGFDRNYHGLGFTERVEEPPTEPVV